MHGILCRIDGHLCSLGGCLFAWSDSLLSNTSRVNLVDGIIHASMAMAWAILPLDDPMILKICAQLYSRR